MSDPSSPHELIITRLINAPRRRVWEAWTDPEQLVRWWGPNGFTNTFHMFDFRIGGAWRFTMHGPDGTDYPNRIIFEEIISMERMAYTHDGDTDVENDPHRFRSTVTFADEDGKTRVTLRVALSSAEELENKIRFGAVEGGNQTLGRLEEFITGKPLS